MHLDERDVSSMFTQIRAVRISSYDQLRLIEEAGEPIPPLWLEKRWYNLLIFLTGENPFTPLAEHQSTALWRSILGGMAIGGDLGQGPARYLWNEEVREIASALALQTRDEFRRRYDDASGHLKKIYDATMKHDSPDTTLDDAEFAWLVESARLLTAYYQTAASRGHAMLLALT